jgi:hypothetical protein
MSSNNSRSRGRARVHETSIGSWARTQSIPCSTAKLKKSSSHAPLSQETTDFLSACRALNQRLIQGIALTWVEVDLIEFSALDLLNNVKPLD